MALRTTAATVFPAFWTRLCGTLDDVSWRPGAGRDEGVGEAVAVEAVVTSDLRVSASVKRSPPRPVTPKPSGAYLGADLEAGGEDDAVDLVLDAARRRRPSR